MLRSSHARLFAFFLLLLFRRGNHECSAISRIYGFHDEIKQKYGAKLFKTFTEVFNCLPFAAIVGKKIFCIHGGLSPELRSMKQIESIKRPCEIPEYGMLCESVPTERERETGRARALLGRASPIATA